MVQTLGRRWVLSLAVPFVALAIGAPARANCVLSPSFGQITQSCGGGTAYCYVQSPGLNTTASLAGAFWSLGFGNPAPGTGNDSGSWTPGEHWLRGEASGTYLAGDWSDAHVDGCITGQVPPGETSEIMTVALSDTDIFNKEGFFAVAAVGRHAPGSPDFDFGGGIQQDLVLAQIPLPQLGVTPTMARVQPVMPQDIAAGFYSDGAVALSQVIVGYRVYSYDGLYPPQDRHRSAWNVFSPVVPLGQPYAVSQCSCCGGGSLVKTFAISLVFANGFETDYVSRSRTIYPCIPENSQDLDSDGDLPPYMGGSDCNDDNPTIYGGAPEINDGIDNQCPGDPGYGSIDEISGLAGFFHPGDKTKFTWHVQAGASRYRVARSEGRDFAGSCTTTLTPLGTFTDPEEPPSGAVFHYLVSAAAPHIGSWGKTSAGGERTVACP